MEEIQAGFKLRKDDESNVPSIIMDDLYVTWTPPPKHWYTERKRPDDKCVLRAVNLNFSDSKLYVVAGLVGSGKVCTILLLHFYYSFVYN